MNTDDDPFRDTRLADLPTALAPGEVRLLLFALDDAAWSPGNASTLLDEAERARAARFHFAHDAARFRAAHTVLRQVLGHHLGRPAQDLRFEHGAAGKPFLAGAPLAFNLAHSAGLGLIGLAAEGAIGVDVERPRPLDDREALIAAHFGPSERAAIDRWPAQRRDEAFFAGWTRKEACVKADGRGLAIPLHSLAVPLGPDLGSGPIGAGGPWRLWSARSREGAWIAAATDTVWGIHAWRLVSP